jgi:MoaA/NifB/PqqE/SkfB family radical SAM enzyme
VCLGYNQEPAELLFFLRCVLKSARDVARRLTDRVNRLPLLSILFGDPGECPCALCRMGASALGDPPGRRTPILAELLRDWSRMERFQVQQVEIHGARALEEEGLPRFCLLLKERGVDPIFHCTSLENGSLKTLAACFQRVVIHLAGSASVHDRIRRSPGSAARLTEDVAQLKAHNRGLAASGRIILEKTNCDNLAEAVLFARSIGLDDVAFTHAELRYEREDRPAALAISDLPRLSRSIESLLGCFGCDFSSGFIATPPAKLWEIYRYFKAFAGAGHLSHVHCRVPWFSCVVRADGAVFGCPLHRDVGNLRQEPLHQIVNGPAALVFRQELNVSQNPVCGNCISHKMKLSDS